MEVYESMHGGIGEYVWRYESMYGGRRVCMEV